MSSKGTGLLLVLLLMLTSFASGSNFTYAQWSKKYITKSKDVALSIALDDGNGFVYLVGRTEGPRGLNVSFPGLIYDNAMQPGRYDDSKLYRDAIIARVSKQDGRVLWAERLLLTQESKFSAVALSTDRLTVYAAGTAISNAENHPFIIQAFNADTGGKKGKIFKAQGKGRHMITTVVGHSSGVYVCGRASNKIGTSLDASTSASGGIIVGSVSETGSLNWLRQAGQNLISDVCSSLSLSENQQTLFMASTSHRKDLPNIGLGLTVVFAIKAQKGQLAWKKKIQISTYTDIRSATIFTKEDAVYVLTSFWAEKDNIRKTYLHKLSKPRGTLLWSKETCCTSILNRDSTIKSFDGMGSATPISGMGMGADRYIYHLAYYRRREEFAKDRYETVVVRTGEYGGQAPERDISAPVQSFRIIPSEPKAAVVSDTSRGIYLLSNDMSITSEDIDLSIPSLNYLTFNDSSVKVTSKPSQGSFYVNITLQLYVSSVTVGAVSDVLAERLRVSHAQLGFISNQTASILSQSSGAHFWIKLYSESRSLDALFKDTEKELTQMFTGTGQSGKNIFERHFGITADSVNLVGGSVDRVEEGLSGTSGDGDTSISNAQNGPPSIENGQRQSMFKWKVFGIAAACLSCAVLVVGGLFFIFKQRDKPEESFVASSFHGRPTGTNGEGVIHTSFENDE